MPSSWPALRSSRPRMLGFVPFYHILGEPRPLSECARPEPRRRDAGPHGRGAPRVRRRRRVRVRPRGLLRARRRAPHHARVHRPAHLPRARPAPRYAPRRSGGRSSRAPAMAQADVRSLEYLLCGAAPLSGSLLAAFREKVRALGVGVVLIQGVWSRSSAKRSFKELWVGYGLTETIGFQLPTRDWVRKAGSIGLLGANYEARLVSESGRDAQEGSPGELWLRGPGMFKVGSVPSSLLVGRVAKTWADPRRDTWATPRLQRQLSPKTAGSRRATYFL